MLPSEERQALPCMHVLHKHCIDTYATCKGESFDRCCPFKCNVSEQLVVSDLDPSQEDDAVMPADGRQHDDVAQSSRATSLVQAALRVEEESREVE